MAIPRHAYLNDLAAKRIAELQADGYNVTFDDAVMLNAICWAMRGVGVDSCGLSRGNPVRVGNITLYPITIQCHDVIENIDTETMTEEDQAYTLAYIMAHAREPFAFDIGLDLDKVAKWSGTLTCTIAELTDAINEIMRQSNDFDTTSKQTESSQAQTVELVSACQRMFGQTAEYWEREVSTSYAMRMVLEEVATKSGKQSPHVNLLTRALAHRTKLIKERGNGKD